MDYIEINHLTKDYGNNIGLFDINLRIKQGEALGIVGANGAGKTTLLRCIMGFIKPTTGNITIEQKDTWLKSAEVKHLIGYVPGEIAFPELRSGIEFLKSQAEFLRLKDFTDANSIISTLKLDTSANLRRMSKGMKQKTAIVECFMSKPKIIILDEPSTGLDPLMRESFLKLLKQAKQNGATIIMTSHLFEELEEICDRVALIEQGKLKEIVSTSKIKRYPYREYNISFKDQKEYLSFCQEPFDIIDADVDINQVTIKVNKKNIPNLLSTLKKYNLSYLTENKYTLERYFNEFVKKES